MKLKVLLPFRILLDEDDVRQVNIETKEGAFGLLERRLDCVAAISPGILSYRNHQNVEIFFAVDQGVAIKTGAQISISVRDAVKGDDLEHLHEVVNEQFLIFDEQATQVRSVVAKLESGFLHQFVDLHHDK